MPLTTFPKTCNTCGKVHSLVHWMTLAPPRGGLIQEDEWEVMELRNCDGRYKGRLCNSTLAAVVKVKKEL